MTVPFFTGRSSFDEEWSALEPLLTEAIDAGVFVNGPLVERLERRIEAYTGSRNAIATGSATEALMVTLQACGIGGGDEVLVPAYTFIASATSVLHAGAQPVFVDVAPETYALDLASADTQITDRTKAIMPVHLFQQMNDMAAVNGFAKRHQLLVIEDSAEAIGMGHAGHAGGTCGTAGVLSFFPTKTLGAIGDAGMILTDDGDLAARCRQLRNHGQVPDARPYTWGLIGHNCRMDDLQAAVLINRLARLDADIACRARLAQLYTDALSGIDGVRCPAAVLPDNTAVYYVYLIEAAARDELVAFLTARGVETEVYYPIPAPLQPCFSHLGHVDSDFPVAAAASERALALPLYPDLTPPQIEYVCESIRSFYGHRGSREPLIEAADAA